MVQQRMMLSVKASEYKKISVQHILSSEGMASRSFHTLSRVDNPFKEDPFRKASYRQPDFDSKLLYGKKTFLGTLGSIAWKIITIPFKVVGAILMFFVFVIGRFVLGKVFKKNMKQMEMMLAKMTLRNARPLSEYYRFDKFSGAAPLFRPDPMFQEGVEVDPVLEDCLNFVDNDQLVYELLKDESIKHTDSIRESFNISVQDSKEKVEKNGVEDAKISFKQSNFLKLLIDPGMINTKQTSPTLMVRTVPVFIMKKMTDKEIEQAKVLKQMEQMKNIDNEYLDEFKLVLPVYLDIHATYYNGQWKGFKKLDILVGEPNQESEEKQLIISFDDLASSNQSSSSTNMGIMDADFVEKK